MKRVLLIPFLLVLFFTGAFAQEILGKRVYGESVSYTTNELMQHWANYPPGFIKKRNYELGLEEPKRDSLPQPVGGGMDISQYPPTNIENPFQDIAAQTIGISFTGATLTDAGAFPPDVMGTVGPTQFVVFVNGRIRTFNKTTGVADGVINIDPDVFFSSVMTPAGAGEFTFTSDPNVRYDRLSGRWFLSIIDVIVNGSAMITKPNRILIAVSNSSIITGSTVWTFNQFQNSALNFADYPSLGIDANALYIGTNQFTLSGSFSGTNAYVINKASLYSGSPVVTVFANLTGTPSGSGPLAPRGVDNYDPNNTSSTAVGYFIGVDNATFSTLMLRRITNPGGTPTISANISLTVPTTTFPNPVTHLGNTGGNNGRLDALDDRLYAAYMRNNHLWTAHNIRVSATGVANTGVAARNASRWYELDVPTSGSPTLIQSGTIFDNTPLLANANQYWIPSIMVSGQGHTAMGFSAAGTPFYINGATTGRFATDVLGTMRDITIYTSTSTAYNPPSNPGGSSGRRWGDYSFTSLDPDDNMTMWTIQEFCSSTNIWGVRAVKLIAPPPVIPTTASPNPVPPNETLINIKITGTIVNGSGFYEPGASFPNHLTASFTGGIIVNSVTFDSTSGITLNINTTGVSNGTYDVTITNPDGQSVSSSGGILTIDSNLPVELSSFTASILHNEGVKLSWHTDTEVNNFGFDIERTKLDGEMAWKKIGFVEGNGNSNSPKNYQFTDNSVNNNKYAYRLKQIDTDGKFQYSKVVEVDFGNPIDFGLSQNYPNPFNPFTIIKFRYNKNTEAQLKVYDVLGNEIANLFGGIAEAGTVYELSFDATALSSGVYYYKLTGNNNTIIKKMMLLK